MTDRTLRDRIAAMPRYRKVSSEPGYGDMMMVRPDGGWLSRDAVLAIFDAHTAAHHGRVDDSRSRVRCHQPAVALTDESQQPAPDAVAEARDPASIIAAVCEEMNGNGFTSKPRIVARADFDLSKFKEQRSDYAGVETEWVDQRGPGMCGDDFYGTLAVPIDAERLFVVEYDT